MEIQQIFIRHTCDSVYRHAFGEVDIFRKVFVDFFGVRVNVRTVILIYEFFILFQVVVQRFKNVVDYILKVFVGVSVYFGVSVNFAIVFVHQQRKVGVRFIAHRYVVFAYRVVDNIRAYVAYYFVVVFSERVVVVIAQTDLS